MNEKHQVREILIQNLLRLMPEDGVMQTVIPNIVLFKHSEIQSKSAELYPPGAAILLQGRKRLIVEGNVYLQSPETYHCLLSPMPMEFETITASRDKPLLGIGIFFDKLKLSRLMLKIENSHITHRPMIEEPESVITTASPNVRLMETLLKLVRTLSNPLEMEVLGQNIEEEIYYQLLNQQGNNKLINLLANKGKVHQIAKAVEYINQHLEENCTIDELSATVSLSPSGFQKKFKEVMHISPIQYAKQVKLNRAKGLILEGMSISQAFLNVGYNNAGQFSREYKRHFGVSPSEELRTG